MLGKLARTMGAHTDPRTALLHKWGVESAGDGASVLFLKDGGGVGRFVNRSGYQWTWYRDSVMDMMAAALVRYYKMDQSKAYRLVNSVFNEQGW